MEGVLRQAFVGDVCIFDLFELWDALAHFESEWRFEYCGCLYGTETLPRLTSILICVCGKIRIYDKQKRIVVPHC